MRAIMLGLALLALALPFLSFDGARAGSLRTVYSVTVRGFPVGRAELQAEFADGHYSIRFSGGIRGLARLFSDAEATAAASGAMSGGRLTPADYKHLWKEDDETETVDMRFAARRLAGVTLDPPQKHPERYVPLSEADRADVLDPVTAFVWPVAGVVTPEICARSLPLMDGKRRFDIDLAFSRTEPFSTRDRSYSARTVVCTFRYRQVAGHRIGKRSEDTITGRDAMEVWMAPAGDGLAAPARIQFSTRMGRVVLTAMRFEAD